MGAKVGGISSNAPNSRGNSPVKMADKFVCYARKVNSVNSISCISRAHKIQNPGFLFLLGGKKC